jgi:hypothetical protein
MFILNEKAKSGKGRDTRFIKLVALTAAAVFAMRFVLPKLIKTGDS